MAAPMDQPAPPAHVEKAGDYKLADPDGSEYFSPGTKEKYGNPEAPFDGGRIDSGWLSENVNIMASGAKGSTVSAFSDPAAMAAVVEEPRRGIVGKILDTLNRERGGGVAGKVISAISGKDPRNLIIAGLAATAGAKMLPTDDQRVAQMSALQSTDPDALMKQAGVSDDEATTIRNFRAKIDAEKARADEERRLRFEGEGFSGMVGENPDITPRR